MEASNNNKVCKAHSGLVAQVEKVEDEVRGLWKKWDKAVMIQFAILGGVMLNLFIVLVQHLTK